MSPFPQTTSYHEAGHALAAVSLGVGIELIKVAPRGSYIVSPFDLPVRGYCWYATPTPEGYAAAIIALAGPLAKMKYQKRRVTTGAAHDLEVFEAEIVKAAPKYGLSQAKLRIHWQALAQDLIDKQWKHINAVAQVLSRSGYMDGKHRLLTLS